MLDNLAESLLTSPLALTGWPQRLQCRVRRWRREAKGGLSSGLFDVGRTLGELVPSQWRSGEVVLAGR